MAIIQWYPGHIAKLERELDHWLGLVDVVLEVRDARMPLATTNPRLRARYGSKPSVILLNKSDLADTKQTAAWVEYLKEAENVGVLGVNAHAIHQWKKPLEALLKRIAAPLQAKRNRQGLKPRPVRVLVAGMPNVGKSSLINALSGRHKAATGHKAGVTRQPQWVRLHESLELLDTPGIIPPILETEMEKHDLWQTAVESGQVQPLSIGEKLATVSSVGDAAFDEATVSARLLSWVDEAYNGLMHTLYEVPEEVPISIESVGQARRWLTSGGGVDDSRTARQILTDFRQGRWVKGGFGVSLEWAPQ